MKPITYILLYPLYLLYLGVMYVRNILFDIKLFPTKKLHCTVISIGNLSFGGTGKTPFTIALAKELKSKYRVAILSRGYKRDSLGTVLVTDGKKRPTEWKTVGDEPYLMSQKLSGVPIVVDGDRYRGGRYLVDNFHPDIILLDDGFQHRKLYRDVDFVLFDASKQGSSTYWREPFGSASRANMFILTKSENVEMLDNWVKRLSAFDRPTASVNTKINDRLIGLNDKGLDVEQLKDKIVITFSGIANSKSFNNTVRQLGCTVLHSFSFKDHNQYTTTDLEEIQKKYIELAPDYILTTEKDIIKLQQSDLPIYALSVCFDLRNGIADIIEKLPLC